MPYVFPKVENVVHSEDEPWKFKIWSKIMGRNSTGAISVKQCLQININLFTKNIGKEQNV